jgi:hypothetical protein
MARPFEDAKNRSTLGLRALEIKLTREQRLLKDKILYFRNKMIAHSDDTKMHFKVSTALVIEEINIPLFQFNERLLLSESELHQLEILLRELIRKMTNFFFKVAQEKPELLNKYRESNCSENNVSPTEKI